MAQGGVWAPTEASSRGHRGGGSGDGEQQEAEEERALLRDVLYGFVGVESDCFRLDLACTSFHYYRRGVPATAACLCCTGPAAATAAAETTGEGDNDDQSGDGAEGRRRCWTTLDSVVVERVLGPLNAVWRVARFCDAEADARSLTVMCFASTLRELVVEHVALFAARLHALLLKDQLSLSKLLLYTGLHVAKPATVAGLLLEVYAERRARRAEHAAALGESAAAAAAVLDTLHCKRVRTFVDAVRDEQATDLLARTRAAVVGTYVRALALPWMTRGTLAGDVYHEFFVRIPAPAPAFPPRDHHVSDSVTDDADEEEDEHKDSEDGRGGEAGGECAVCEARLVPKFVRRAGLEGAVLEAGRCVCLANRGRTVAAAVDARDVADAPLAALVAACTARSNRLLLDAVCGGRSRTLVATFTRLRDRHLFLGAARDVLARFLAHFRDELCREVAEFRGRPDREAQENRLFREYCRQWVPTTSTNGDGDTDDGGDDGGDCAWVLECCACGGAGEEEEEEEGGREGALLAETVRARVRVPRAYEVLVDGESVRAYETLSTALVLLHFCQDQFVHAAYRCFTLDTAQFAASRHAKGFYVALFEMRTLVARLVQFVYDSVVAPGFARFVARAAWMLAGGTIDIAALRAMHTAFVRECAAASTLADARCREYLVLLLRTVMEYCQLLQAVHANLVDAAMADAPARTVAATTALLDDALAHCVDTRDALRKQLFELLAGWLHHAAVHPPLPSDTRFTAAFSDLLQTPPALS